jgi:hypothetical protein
MKGLNNLMRTFTKQPKITEHKVEDTKEDKVWAVLFNEIPTTLDEMLKLPEATLDTPYNTAALLVMAFCNMPDNAENAYKMIEYLYGPRGLSNYDKQFIRDRFMDGNIYVAKSYLAGTSPENNYTPNKPYKILLYSNEIYDKDSEKDLMTMMLQSSGADSKRNVKLKLKPSTNQWFVWEQYLLPGIRKAASQDEWA